MTVSKTKKTVRGTVRYVVLIVCSLILILPFLSLFTTSFKTFEDAVGNANSLIPKPFTLDNYVRSVTEQGYLRGLWNSVHISVLTTIGTVFSSSLVAYAFARFVSPDVGHDSGASFADLNVCAVYEAGLDRYVLSVLDPSIFGRRDHECFSHPSVFPRDPENAV